MQSISALISGFVFAVGLAIGGMTDPLKVVSFLDVTGQWDPSLAFVMGGAIAVYAPVHQLMKRRTRPLVHSTFHWPTRRDIDVRLVVGASLFGVGWGLGGFCPGPAVVSTASLHADALTFTTAMLGGMLLLHLADRVWHEAK